MSKTFWSVEYTIMGAMSSTFEWFDNKDEAEAFATRDYADNPVRHTYRSEASIKEAEYKTAITAAWMAEAEEEDEENESEDEEMDLTGILWTEDSFGSICPKNCEEIAEAVNREMLQYAEQGYEKEELKNESETMWEQFCANDEICGIKAVWESEKNEIMMSKKQYWLKKAEEFRERERYEIKMALQRLNDFKIYPDEFTNTAEHAIEMQIIAEIRAEAFNWHRIYKRTLRIAQKAGREEQ